MAISYPGISYLRGYDSPGNLVGKFQEGYDFTKGIKDEAGAVNALDAYVNSLYGGAAQTGQALPAITLGAGAGGGRPRTDAPIAGADDYLARVRVAESGGNDAARNPKSSATGRYQFLEGTWADLAKRHPDLGLTPDGRTDPNQQERAMKVFTAENARALKGSGVPVNPGTLYAAHFLGAGAAPKVLTGDPNSPVSAYVDPAVVQANPQLADMTVAEFQQWAASKGGNAQGGYAPPGVAQPAGAQPMAAGGASALPPKEVLQELFRNPITRPLGVELIKAAQEGRAAKPVVINDRLVDPTTGKVIGDYSDAALGDTADAPSTVREWEYFNSLPPEDQAAYLRMKRAVPYLDVGTGFVQPDPVNPGTVAGGPIVKQNEQEAFDTSFGKATGDAAGAAAAGAPGDIAAGETALSIINQIKTHPDIAEATGVSAPLNEHLIGTGRFDFQNLVEQAKSGAFLTAIQEMRGLGALSNAEGQTATAAVTRMNTALSKDAFLKAVADYEAIIQRGIERAKSKLPGSEAPAAPAVDDPLGIR